MGNNVPYKIQSQKSIKLRDATRLVLVIKISLLNYLLTTFNIFILRQFLGPFQLCPAEKRCHQRMVAGTAWHQGASLRWTGSWVAALQAGDREEGARGAEDVNNQTNAHTRGGGQNPVYPQRSRAAEDAGGYLQLVEL